MTVPSMTPHCPDNRKSINTIPMPKYPFLHSLCLYTPVNDDRPRGKFWNTFRISIFVAIDKISGQTHPPATNKYNLNQTIEYNIFFNTKMWPINSNPTSFQNVMNIRSDLWMSWLFGCWLLAVSWNIKFVCSENAKTLVLHFLSLSKTGTTYSVTVPIYIFMETHHPFAIRIRSRRSVVTVVTRYTRRINQSHRLRFPETVCICVLKSCLRAHTKHVIFSTAFRPRHPDSSTEIYISTSFAICFLPPNVVIANNRKHGQK